MTIKLKSKDEVTAKLIEELDEYTSLSLASHIDNTFDEALAESYGEISMLKWVLGIKTDEEQSWNKYKEKHNKKEK